MKRLGEKMWAIIDKKGYSVMSLKNTRREAIKQRSFHMTPERFKIVQVILEEVLPEMKYKTYYPDILMSSAN